MKILLDQSFPSSIATLSYHGHILGRCDAPRLDGVFVEKAAEEGFEIAVMLGCSVLADNALLDRCRELPLALAVTTEEHPVIAGNNVTANLLRLVDLASPGAVLVIKKRSVTRLCSPSS